MYVTLRKRLCLLFFLFLFATPTRDISEPYTSMTLILSTPSFHRRLAARSPLTLHHSSMGKWPETLADREAAVIQTSTVSRLFQRVPFLRIENTKDFLYDNFKVINEKKKSLYKIYVYSIFFDSYIYIESIYLFYRIKLTSERQTLGNFEPAC